VWPLRPGGFACHLHDVGKGKSTSWASMNHPARTLCRGMIDFEDTLPLRRSCSGTSTRWCEIRVGINGFRAG
jgi:hypothetical protein